VTDFEALIRRLGAADIRFVLVGGFAGTMLGSPGTTVDLDIVYARGEENLARLAAALEPLQPRLRGAPPGLPFVLDSATLARGLNFTLTTTLRPGPSRRGDRGRRLQGPAAAHAPHAGLRHGDSGRHAWIRLERAAGRTKDLVALAELEALLEEQGRDS